MSRFRKQLHAAAILFGAALGTALFFATHPSPAPANADADDAVVKALLMRSHACRPPAPAAEVTTEKTVEKHASTERTKRVGTQRRTRTSGSPKPVSRPSSSHGHF